MRGGGIVGGGIVYLVGAGPGDPELITVRGLACIQTADVVAYDRLVSPALVARARPGAELICVGKEAGRHGRTQQEISDLLADLADRGLAVCRLKGGDPFVFGRGGEEADVLARRGIAYVVVPGITSGVAAPAFAGIPVTHREHGASVAFVTGHDAAEKAGSGVDWARTAHAADTLVIYMGIGEIVQTAQALQAAGRRPETPVAVIRWGSRAEQATVTATLATVAGAVAAAGLLPPAIIVVGEVVALRPRLAWSEARPLHGRRVLVPTTPDLEPEAAALATPLRAMGAEVWEWPVPRPELGGLLRRTLAEGGVQSIAFPGPAAVAALVAQIGAPFAQIGAPFAQAGDRAPLPAPQIICADDATRVAFEQVCSAHGAPASPDLGAPARSDLGAPARSGAVVA